MKVGDDDFIRRSVVWIVAFQKLGYGQVRGDFDGRME